MLKKSLLMTLCCLFSSQAWSASILTNIDFKALGECMIRVNPQAIFTQGLDESLPQAQSLGTATYQPTGLEYRFHPRALILPQYNETTKEFDVHILQDPNLKNAIPPTTFSLPTHSARQNCTSSSPQSIIQLGALCEKKRLEEQDFQGCQETLKIPLALQSLHSNKLPYKLCSITALDPSMTQGTVKQQIIGNKADAERFVAQALLQHLNYLISTIESSNPFGTGHEWRRNPIVYATKVNGYCHRVFKKDTPYAVRGAIQNLCEIAATEGRKNKCGNKPEPAAAKPTGMDI